jgi:nitrite reductase/ring-hydroxylating ferredoxin subunit
MSSPDSRLVALCPLDELTEGTSRGFEHGELKVFAVKYGGKIFIYRNICPHLGIPLEWREDHFLDNSGTMIQCANHGALFVIKSGQCVAGPCAGRNLQPVHYQIIDNRIWIEPA